MSGRKGMGRRGRKIIRRGINDMGESVRIEIAVEVEVVENKWESRSVLIL